MEVTYMRGKGAAARCMSRGREAERQALAAVSDGWMSFVSLFFFATRIITHFFFLFLEI
jgi:hypothetical protein